MINCKNDIYLLPSLLRLSITCELWSSRRFIEKAFYASEGSKGHVPELRLVDFDPFCLFLLLDVQNS